MQIVGIATRWSLVLLRDMSTFPNIPNAERFMFGCQYMLAMNITGCCCLAWCIRLQMAFHHTATVRLCRRFGKCRRMHGLPHLLARRLPRRMPIGLQR